MRSGVKSHSHDVWCSQRARVMACALPPICFIIITFGEKKGGVKHREPVVSSTATACGAASVRALPPIWFYKTLGGIHVDEKDPGFKSIVIKPYAPDSLSWVKTSVQTVKGVVRSEWIRAIKNYKLKVSIPFGSEAIVYVFGNSLNQIEEGNISAKIAKNVNFLRMEGKYAVFHVESGEYNFNSTF